MSKVLYVCARDSASLLEIEKKINVISKRITPDNITWPVPEVFEDEGIAYGIFNRVDSVSTIGTNVLMGKVFPDTGEWHVPGGDYPDGSYSIFRSDKDTVEVLTDVVATRSVWYYKDEKIFVASSSQRAIIMMLGSFVFNPQTISWVLSSGTLGPSNSWDSRISPVPADAVLKLDRQSWSVDIHITPVNFSPVDIPDKEHEHKLKETMIETFRSLRLDYSRWVLPLSGGYDSRLILCLLKAYSKSIGNLRSITWGLKRLLTVKGNDPDIAKSLAKHFNIDHTYYNIDNSEESIDVVFQRYLVCGEGRIDHISGYLDGFELWKQLYENKIGGVIRGDIGFTSKPAEKPNFVRFRQGFGFCSDFDNLKDYESYGFPKQIIPERFLQMKAESLEQWRDRLYQEFKLPIVLSALTDLKLPYVEVINPLLSRKIIYYVRQLPDHLRNKKVVMKNIVKSLSPKIEMASDIATADIEVVLKSKQVTELFIRELSDSAHTVIPYQFSKYIVQNLRVSVIGNSNRSRLKSVAKRYMPLWIRHKFMFLKSNSKVEFNHLAFRVFTILRMNKMLTEDAEAIRVQDLTNSFAYGANTGTTVPGI